jgi:hypothetical protein
MRAGAHTFKTILMSYTREPNWQKLKPEIDWDEQEEKLADKLNKYINQNKQTVMNQGIVKSQKFVRTWDGPSGAIHYFDLVVESNNGLNEVGQIGVKDMNSPKIAVGATLHYTVEERTGPTGKKSTNFKMQNPMQYPGTTAQSAPSGAVNSAVNYRKESPDVQNSISKSVALNNAVLFCKEQKGSKPGDVLDTAEIFLAWLKGEAVEAVEIKAVTNESADDEMPF